MILLVPRKPNDCDRNSRIIGTTSGREALGFVVSQGVGVERMECSPDDEESVEWDFRLATEGRSTLSSGESMVVPESL